MYFHNKIVASKKSCDLLCIGACRRGVEPTPPTCHHHSGYHTCPATATRNRHNRCLQSSTMKNKLRLGMLRALTIYILLVFTGMPSLTPTLFHGVFFSQRNDALLRLVTPAAAVRFGIVANLEGVVGRATRWAVDGFLAGIHEHNRNATTTAIGAVLRNNASDFIHVTIMNTHDDYANTWKLVPKEMANESTRLDALALAPGPVATNTALNASLLFNLPVFGPIPGDRDVYLAFNPMTAILTPIPDSEIAALVEEVVVRRQLKRIAVMTTDFHPYGNDLVPYLKTLLAEFGLELVYHVVMPDPYGRNPTPTGGPIQQQLRGLGAANVQAMFMLCAFYIETGGLILQAMAIMNFKAIVVTLALTMPLMDGVLDNIPTQIRTPNSIISTLYFPLHNDLSFMLSRSYRNAFTEATTGGFVNASTTLAEQDSTNTLAGNFGVSGYAIARLVSAVVAAHNGAPGPITAATLQEKAFSRRIFTLDDINMGPFSPPCNGKQKSFCSCNSGARAVFLAAFDVTRRLVAIPGAQYTLPDGACIPFGALVRSPLVVLAVRYNMATGVSAGIISSDEEALSGIRASDAFLFGHAAALFNATETPSTRTPIILKQVYEAADQRANLETLQADRLITAAVGSVLTAPLGGGGDDAATTSGNLPNTNNNISAVSPPISVFIDPLLVGGPQRLHRSDAGTSAAAAAAGSSSASSSMISPFQRRVIYTMATLDQEVHAVAKALGRRGIALLSTADNTSASASSTPATFHAANELAIALRKSLHTFEFDTLGAVLRVPPSSTVAAMLDAVLTPAPGSVLLVNGIRTAADVHSLARYVQRGLSSVGAGAAASSSSSAADGIVGAAVVLPFATIRVWYDVLTAAIPDEGRQRHLLFATSLPNWHPNSPTANTSTLLKDYHESLPAAVVAAERAAAAAAAANSSNVSTTAPPTTSNPSTNSSKTPGPQSLLGFLTQRLVANIAERIPSRLTDASFLSTLYTVSVIVLDPNGQQPYIVGPFSDQSCTAASSSSSSAVVIDSTRCEMNIGARSVFVRSLASTAAPTFVFPSTSSSSNLSSGSSTSSASSSVDASGAIGSFSFASGRVQYVPLPSSPGISTTIIALAAVGGALLIAAIAALIAIRVLSGRNNRAAPKNAKRPFTIIFTDIQSSTSLWAEIPDVMGPALAAHHAVIRELIAKHNGYEVKTIGDAFMIAFSDADDAVALAFDLQFAFLTSPAFPSHEIDQAYIAFEHEKAFQCEEDAAAAANNKNGGFAGEGDLDYQKGLYDGEDTDGTTTPASGTAAAVTTTAATAGGGGFWTINLSPEDYAARWHGLRVRVGIHTGFGDIQKDPVTGGYDYYGTVVNTAARIEAAAHGGQVLMSADTLQSLQRFPLLVQHYEDAMKDYEKQNHNNNNDENNNNKKKKQIPCQALSVGQAELRGLSNPVSLYQLETVPRRVFPPLRLEEGGGGADDSDDDNNQEVDDFSGGNGGDATTSFSAPGSSQRPSNAGLGSPSAEGVAMILGGSRRNSSVGSGVAGVPLLGSRAPSNDGQSGISRHTNNPAGGDGGDATSSIGHRRAHHHNDRLTQIHAMGVLGALVACVPPQRRWKELQRLADLWRLQIKFTNNNNNNNTDKNHNTSSRGEGAGGGAAGGRMSPTAAAAAKTNNISRAATALSRGDARVGQCLEVLGKHIAPIAAKMVLNSNTTNTTTNTNTNVTTHTTRGGLLAVPHPQQHHQHQQQHRRASTVNVVAAASSPSPLSSPSVITPTQLSPTAAPAATTETVTTGIVLDGEYKEPPPPGLVFSGTTTTMA